jgi:hypothetical protein
MINKIIDIMAGEKEHFDKIYNKIYGRNKTFESEKNVKENIRKYQFLVLIFGLILIMDVINEIKISDSNIIENNGYIKEISRPESGTYNINLIAEIKGTNRSFVEEIPINISALIKNNSEAKEKSENQKEIDQRILYELLGSIRQIEASNMGNVILPKELEDGSSIKWMIKNNNNIIYLILLFILSVCSIYYFRFSKVKKLENDVRKSVLEELPDLINKIILLLNAGLVFSSAFSRIVYLDEFNKKETYLSSQLIEIISKVEATNNSLILELKMFSERVQVRELIRVINIISDNVYMGALLVEKLEIESDLIWENRRKFVEEQNRINETKLSFPLAIHLMVLISITIAPALINT